MKRTRIFSLLIATALLLGMSGMVSAQEPEFLSAFSYVPTTLYTGNIVQMTLSGFFGAGGSGECLEIIVDTNWTNGGAVVPIIVTSTNFPTGPMAAGNCGTAMPVPGNPNGDSRFFVNVSGGAPGGFETMNIWFGNLPAGSVGSGYTIRAINAVGVFGASYIDASPGGAGGITVNAAATTRYVANNSTQCQGYTPCDTGTGGLAAALGDGTATDIVVLGAYNADPTSPHTLAGGDNLRGQGGASININGACQSGSPFLTVSGASTIEDLTFDGTCSSGNPSAGISITGAGATIQDVTVKDFANVGVLVSGSGSLTNDGVTYDNNGTGASVAGGSATFDSDTFTDNTTGVAVSGGTATVTSSSFDGNTTGVNHTGGTANIGTTDGDGNTFAVPAGGTGISSAGGAGGAIQDNTITGGSYGIYLAAASTNVYANTVSGAATQQIGCSGSFAGAGFNYIGASIGGGGTNCSDGTDQLGSPIVAWTDSALTLNECTIAGSGPIFDLGNVAPYGYSPPLGRDSRYYATTSTAGAVTISGSGGNQFKMLMDSTGCNPMTYACWEDSATRTQSNAGYYFYGTQDPTALTLANVTAESPNVWLPVAMAVVALVAVGGALLLLRRRRAL
jgi:parallel beta-helix repeat protein